ncbi:MAG: polya polymerase [Clostridia bacterium]|nr:polya polymerase [Clostridia bacterium]
MKITNIADPEGFFKKVQQCKGRVELVTSEGDRINLKSKLSQYIMLTKLFSEAKIGEMEILVSEPEDLHLILDYLIRG